MVMDHKEVILVKQKIVKKKGSRTPLEGIRLQTIG